MAGKEGGRFETRRINDEVLYATGSQVSVGRANVNQLKSQAAQNPRKRIRLCAHPDTDDQVHEMVIIHSTDTYVRPHKHLTKTESLHVVEGTGQLVYFDDDGSISEVITLGDFTSGNVYFHRMRDHRYHSLLISTDYLVFHETANGPFNQADTVFPSWAPEASDGPDTAAYLQKLRDAVLNFQ